MFPECKRMFGLPKANRLSQTFVTTEHEDGHLPEKVISKIIPEANTSTHCMFRIFYSEGSTTIASKWTHNIQELTERKGS